MSAARVVIVEDEFLVALQLEDIILDCGHEVIATVPDLASVAAVCDAPAVALVDLNLRDGPTGPLIAKMLSEQYGTRIIYVTANSGQIGVPAETTLGVVHKPFTRAAIEDAIAYALDETLTVRRPAELQQIEQVALLRVG